MMLSAPDLARESDRCRQLGVSRQLIKPIASEDLRQVLWDCDSEPQIAPSADQTTRSLDILLVEDNEINRRALPRACSNAKATVSPLPLMDEKL